MKTKQVFPIAAVALAVAMVAPVASAEVQAYLSLRPTLESTQDIADGATKVERHTEFGDYYSRFGIKGSQQFGDLTVGVLGEYRAEGTLGDARYAYGYVKGDFGQVKFGQTDDVMANNVSAMTELGWSDGASFGRFYLEGHVGSGFKDKNLRYTYKTDAFSADVSTRRVSDSEREHNIGGQVYFGDITVGAAYKQVEQDKTVALGTSYSSGPLTIAGTYHQVDVDGQKDKPSSIELAAAYSLTDKITVDAVITSFDKNVKSFEFVDSKGESFDPKVKSGYELESAYAIGASYKLAPNALIFTTYEVLSNKHLTGANKIEDFTKATIGMKFDFNIMSAGGMQQ